MTATTIRTAVSVSLSAALALGTLFIAPPEAEACGSWEETKEKVLALDAEGTHALVLATTSRVGYDGSSEHHRLFVVDLRVPRPEASPLVIDGLATEIALSPRARTMPADALAARLVRRHAARFPFRA